MPYKEIKECRVCGNKNLSPVVNLGELALTGIFPKTKNEEVDVAPLELVKCHGDNCCHLLQLKHSMNMEKMYGNNYGYRSGLNPSMVAHLQAIVRIVTNTVSLQPDDLIIDIGSNDGTLLRNYFGDYNLVAFDPTAAKFSKYYPANVDLFGDFFSKEIFRSHYRSVKAKVVTSIAMFYDLPKPLEFMQDVYDILDDKGIWVLEQSYMPEMIKQNAYDTVCHEHLEYYGLYQIRWMADRVGFKIVNVEFNSTNGGSFLVILAKKGGGVKGLSNEFFINTILKEEQQKGFLSLAPYKRFRKNIFKHTSRLIEFIERLNRERKVVVGYGASTKGNVLLQLCNFNERDIPCIVEINEDKFGCFTPGTKIPIVSQKEAESGFGNIDYLFVLPWHFKDNILKKEEKFLKAGMKFIFPLPDISVVGGKENE